MSSDQLGTIYSRWEAEDDPWQEHKKLNPGCAFMRLNKEEDNWKVEDVIKIEVQRQRSILAKQHEEMISNFKEEAAMMREKIVETFTK